MLRRRSWPRHLRSPASQLQCCNAGRLNDQRTRIDFEFRTSGQEDGFDFQVSESATEIGFDLKVMGYEHPEMIVVGSKGLNPPTARFSLPGHSAAKDAAQPASPPKR